MKALFKNELGILMCIDFDSVHVENTISHLVLGTLYGFADSEVLIKACSTQVEAESIVRRIYDGDGDLTK